MAPTLTARAISWKESDHDELENLATDITTAINKMQDPSTDDDKGGVRSASEELLIREKLPTFHRAQLLVYKAATEKADDYERIRERLEDAKYWIVDLKVLQLRGGGEVDGKVIELEKDVDERLTRLNAVDPSSTDGGAAFEEKLNRTARMMEGGWNLIKEISKEEMKEREAATRRKEKRKTASMERRGSGSSVGGSE